MKLTKITIRKKIFIILTIAWMIVIFSFSAKPADESTAISNAVGMRVGQILMLGFENWPLEEQELFAEKIDHPIRKCAHAFEYAVLAVLLLGVIVEDRRKKHGIKEQNNLRAQYLLVFAISVAYAASDEVHQLFVPGRAGMLKDVLIDSGGAAFGMIFVCCVTSACKLVKTYGSDEDK